MRRILFVLLFFYLFVFIVIFQRLMELLLAKRNEVYLKKQGAFEVGRGHYKYIVLLHLLFLISLIFEVHYYSLNLTTWSWLPLVGFLLAQSLRLWTISSLGRFWNTRILVLPNSKVICKGPYRFLKHPNYLVVILEFFFIPLIFQAYLTLVIFFILNLAVLSIRIPIEEKALKEATNYGEVFANRQYYPDKI